MKVSGRVDVCSIDVAYRVLQTSQPVDISAVVHHGSDVISILIPCEVRCKPASAMTV